LFDENDDCTVCQPNDDALNCHGTCGTGGGSLVLTVQNITGTSDVCFRTIPIRYDSTHGEDEGFIDYGNATQVQNEYPTATAINVTGVC